MVSTPFSAQAADDRAEQEVVGDLRALRQRAHRLDPAADHAKVDERDRRSRGRTGERPAAARQRPLEHRRPEDRQRQVDGRGRDESQRRGGALADDDRAGGLRRLQRVAPRRERVRRRRRAGQRRGDERRLREQPQAAEVTTS
jgi:hypothetical protein